MNLALPLKGKNLPDQFSFAIRNYLFYFFCGFFYLKRDFHQHVKNPQAVINEVHRICKKNGFFIITVPYEDSMMKLKRFFGKLGLGRPV
jgi:SAM-dependent methyltransferase